MYKRLVKDLYYLAKIRKLSDGTYRILTKPGGFYIGEGLTKRSAWKDAHLRILLWNGYETGTGVPLMSLSIDDTLPENVRDNMKVTWVEIGQHRFWPKISRLMLPWSFSLSVQIKFTQDIDYVGDEKPAISKLFGIGKNFHHWESARFGFNQTEKGSYNIWAYGYESGKRIERLLTTINIGEPILLEIDYRSYSFIYKINGVEVFKQESKAKGYFFYALNPYFGGKMKAPHRFQIRYEKFN